MEEQDNRHVLDLRRYIYIYIYIFIVCTHTNIKLLFKKYTMWSPVFIKPDANTRESLGEFESLLTQAAGEGLHKYFHIRPNSIEFLHQVK